MNLAGIVKHDLNGVMRSPLGQKPDADANPLIDVTNNRNPPAAGGATIPVPVCVPPICTVVPVAIPGTTGYAAGNATLSSGSNGGAEGASGSKTSSGTANSATAPKLADDLAAGMSKPVVSDTKLGGLMDDLYRDGAKIGTGSTADAVRYETEAGLPVGGVFHTQKAEDYSVALQRWLDLNPNASFSDRSAAQNVLRDLQNALKVK